MKENTLGIYIHVPFCKSKCPYCDFYSVTSLKVENYVQKVCSEIRHYGKDLNKAVDTVYFGGGTPSLLECENIYKILDVINKNFKVCNPEITMEINPADYKFMDFKKLKSYGVNRISVGAQSINDSELKTLGRRHSSQDVFSACGRIKAAGIENISCDIILGIPDQNDKSIEDFLNFYKGNKIPHISAYLLKIEKGTLFYQNQKTLNFPSEDKSVRLYTLVCKMLAEYYYNHYEISNFSVPGFESKHNLKYWNLDDYLGIGPSAHSLIDNKRFYYPSDLNGFISGSGVLNEGVYEPEKEYSMLRLRLARGLEHSLYKSKFGKGIPQNYFNKARKYTDLGFIKIDSSGLRLTEKGFLVSNFIISDILL